MVQINFARKEINCKIVYYGPGLSGKTTNLEMVHEKAPNDCKGDLTSISTDGDRTLFFDFMPLDLGSIAGMRTKFHIYTVPGQVYYNSTRKLVLLGADGIIFVADSSPDAMESNLQSIENLKENLAEMGKDIAKMPLVIQYNKRDVENPMSLEDMEDKLNKFNAPSLEAIAYKGEGVIRTLKAISSLVLESINAGERNGALVNAPVGGPGAMATPEQEALTNAAHQEQQQQQAPVENQVPVGVGATQSNDMAIERNAPPGGPSVPSQGGAETQAQGNPGILSMEQQMSGMGGAPNQAVNPTPPAQNHQTPPQPEQSNVTIETAGMNQPVQTQAPQPVKPPPSQEVISKRTEQQAKTNAVLREERTSQPQPPAPRTPPAKGGPRVIGGVPRGTKKKGGSAMGVIIIIGVVLLLAGAGVAYYMMM